MSESLNQHEPTPQPSDHPAAWDLVLFDIHERDAMGTAKYKVRLTPFNGRNFIKDAYQEALDLTVYLRGAVYEIETLQAKIAELERQLAEESKRADDNWTALDRIRAKYSDEVNTHKETKRQLAEAEEETARLDWLLVDIQPCKIGDSKDLELATLAAFSDISPCESVPDEKWNKVYVAECREAIDAARKGTK